MRYNARNEHLHNAFMNYNVFNVDTYNVFMNCKVFNGYIHELQCMQRMPTMYSCITINTYNLQCILIHCIRCIYIERIHWTCWIYLLNVSSVSSVFTSTIYSRITTHSINTRDVLILHTRRATYNVLIFTVYSRMTTWPMNTYNLLAVYTTL